MKVLALDKDLSDLQSVVSLLKQSEFSVLHSTNLSNAVKLFQSYSPDIIIMDPDFSEIQGCQIINDIREQFDVEVPVLFISRDLNSSNIIAGMSVGGECLSKPLNPVLFKAKLSAIQRMIDMKERYSQMSVQLQKASEDLKKFTYIDSLTGLINRNYLFESIKKEIARGIRYQQSIALFYIEVDDFSQYRERYGVQKSNDCLKQIADILSSYCRCSIDISAHCGAELFALLLPDTSADGSMILAQRICESIEAAQIKHDCSNISDVCTVTIGVTSSIPQQGEKKDNLLSLADTALVQARRAGHNVAKLANFHTVKAENLGAKLA